MRRDEPALAAVGDDLVRAARTARPRRPPRPRRAPPASPRRVEVDQDACACPGTRAARCRTIPRAIASSGAVGRAAGVGGATGDGGEQRRRVVDARRAPAPRPTPASASARWRRRSRRSGRRARPSARRRAPPRRGVVVSSTSRAASVERLGRARARAGRSGRRRRATDPTGAAAGAARRPLDPGRRPERVGEVGDPPGRRAAWPRSPPTRAGGRRRRDTARAGLDPVALPAERVARAGAAVRRSDPANRARSTSTPAAHARPTASRPYGGVVDLLVRVAQARDRRDRLHRLAAGVRRQRVAGTELEQHERAVGEHRAQAVGEAHRVAQVVDPVLRVGRLLGGDPGAGQVRQVRASAAATARRRGRPRGTRAGSGRAASCGRRRRAGSASASTSSVATLLRAGSRCRRPGRRSTHSSSALIVATDSDGGSSGSHLGLRQRHGEHRRAGAADPVHQRGPGDDQVERVVEREHAGEVGGGVLAEAVADERARRRRPRPSTGGRARPT